ncbi:MAG: MFS transporter [Kiritimatiellae bacterium]|nr:MFS transporter [Kiritimatiellia bacterium]
MRPRVEPPHSASPAAESPARNARTYHCGTLSYTWRGLLVLFAWLLWGDFCWTLMEAVVPSALPLKLKALGAPNWLMAVIMSTLPGILNMTICPWVSFKSDRFRSRWGRRIPFILWTSPFLCLFLLGMGWSESIAGWAQVWLPPLRGIAPATLIIALLAVFMVGFTFFNMFVCSVFWYLFNDVVPAKFLGRFYGLFRMVGTLAGALFSGFIFKYSETHMREIFTGAALLYSIGFGLVCLRVKEGEYPPPPPAPKGNAFQRLASDTLAFGRESFSHRFFWLFYLWQTVSSLGGAVGIFSVFFSKDMGLNLDQIGKLGAVNSVAAMLAMYGAAIYVDRWHPLRISLYFATFGAVGAFGGWIWLAVSPPPIMYFWMGMTGVLTAFGQALSGNAGLPVFMRLMPPSRYGQMCSANSIIRSIGTVVGGLIAGAAVDMVLKVCHGSNYAYRFLFLWPAVCNIVALVLVSMVYRQWKCLGGDEHYRAPAPWQPEGFEPMTDGHIPVPFRPRWLLLVLNINTLLFALAPPATLGFIIWLQGHGMTRAIWWHAWVFLPVSFLYLGTWLWQASGIRRDVRSVAAGQRPAYGIPHHGVPMVLAIQGAVSWPLPWIFRAWFMTLGREQDIIWYGVATSLVVPFTTLLAYRLIRLIEREPANITMGLDSNPVSVQPVAGVVQSLV